MSSSRLAVKTTSGEIVTLDAKDGSDVHIVADGKEGEGANLVYSACSNFIVDGSWQGSLTVRDANTGTTEFRRHRDGEMVQAVSADAKRQTWAIHHCRKCPTGSPQPDYISLWGWPFSEPKIFEHASRFISAFALSENGEFIAICTQVHKKGYHFTVHSAADFEVVASHWLDEAAHILEICWKPDGKEIALVWREGFCFYRFPELTLAATFDMNYAADIAYTHTGGSVALSGWQCGLLLDREAIQPL